MEKYLNKGQVSKLEIKIDPSSMGAMIIRIREKYDDRSVKTKIQKLNRAMGEIF